MRLRVAIVPFVLAVHALSGCATGREKEPIAEWKREADVGHVRVFDAWSTRQMKGSLYTTLELAPGWSLMRRPTVQASGGSVQGGRFGSAFYEFTYHPLDAESRLATGAVTIQAFWEAGNPDGRRKAGRTQIDFGVAENLALNVLGVTSAEKDVAGAATPAPTSAGAPAGGAPGK